MSSAANRLTAWIVQASYGEGSSRRIEILRDAALTIASPEAATELITIAREIEQTEARIGQLLLELNGNGNSEPETPTPNGGPRGPSPAEDVP